MGNKELIAERFVQSLLFEVETVPQKHTILESHSKNTPLNVKIKVRKKEDVANEHGIISVTRNNAETTDREKIFPVNSDQTIMSFDVTMEGDFDKQPVRKHRKRIFDIFKPGICLNTQANDDDYPYMPASSYNSNTLGSSISSKSEEIYKRHFPISKRNNAFVTSPSYSKQHKIFLGKCKPGGCLDPPFGEDNFPYSPTAQTTSMSQQKTIKKKPEKNKNNNRNSGHTVAPNSTFIKNKDMSMDDSLNVKIATKEELNKNSIVNIYQAESMNTSISTTHSNSIITYPPTLTSSYVHLNNEKNTKHRISNQDNQSKKSFNEFSDSYFMPPKKTSNQLTQKAFNKNVLKILVTNIDDKLADKYCLKDNKENSEVSRTSISALLDNTSDVKRQISITKDTELAAEINIKPTNRRPGDFPKEYNDSEDRDYEENKMLLLKTHSSHITSHTGLKITDLELSSLKSDICSQNSNDILFKNQFKILNNTDYPKFPPRQSNLENLKENDLEKDVLKHIDLKTEPQVENYKYEQSDTEFISSMRIPSFKIDSENRSNVDYEQNYGDHFSKNVKEIPLQIKSSSMDGRIEPELISENKKVETSYKPNISLENIFSSEPLKIRVSSTSIVDKEQQNFSTSCEATVQPHKSVSNLFPQILESDLGQVEDFKDVHTPKILIQLDNSLSRMSPIIRADISNEIVRHPHKFDPDSQILTHNSLIKAEYKTFNQNLQENFGPADHFKDSSELDISRLTKQVSMESTKFKTGSISNTDKTTLSRESMSKGLIRNSSIKSENIYFNHSSRTDSVTEALVSEVMAKTENPKSDRKLSKESIQSKIVPSNYQAGKLSKIESISEESQKLDIISAKVNDSISSAKAISEAQISIPMKQSINTNAQILPILKSNEHEQTIIRVDSKYKTVSETPSYTRNSECPVKQNFIDNHLNRQERSNKNYKKIDNVANHSISPNRIIKLCDGFPINEESTKDVAEVKYLTSESTVKINATLTSQTVYSLKVSENNIPQTQDQILVKDDSILSRYEPSIKDIAETPAVTNMYNKDNVITSSISKQSFQQENVKNISEKDLKESIHTTYDLPSATFSIENVVTQIQTEDKKYSSLDVSNFDNINRTVFRSHLHNTTKDIPSNVVVSETQMLKESNGSLNLTGVLPEVSKQENKSRQEEISLNTSGLRDESVVNLPIRDTFDQSDILNTKSVNLIKSESMSGGTENPQSKLKPSQHEKSNILGTLDSSGKNSSRSNHSKPFISPIRSNYTQLSDELSNKYKFVKDKSPKVLLKLNAAKVQDSYQELQVEDSIKSYKDSNMNANSSAFQSLAQTTSTLKSTHKEEKVFVDFAFQSYANNNKERILKTYDSAKEPLRYTNDTLVLVKSQIGLSKEMRIPIDTENNIFIQINQMGKDKEDAGVHKILPDHSKPKPVEKVIEANNQKIEAVIHESEAKTYNEIVEEKVLDSLRLIYEQELVPLQNIIRDMKEEIDVLAEQQELFKNQLSNKKIKSLKLINPNKRCGCLRKYL